MLLQIKNGAVSFGDDVILYDLDFEIRGTEKIAVVGRNGCGKTTLLKVLSGELELELSEKTQPGGMAKTGAPEIGYLKQIAFDDPSITLEDEVRKCVMPMILRKEELERLAVQMEMDHSEETLLKYTQMEESFRNDGGYYFEKEYEVMIRKFGFSDEEFKKPVSEFSGGQQTKIAFIKLLLSKPDILLLDEPTNHLDVTTIEWLETYLKTYPKAVVVVSHDRMFLDNVVSVVYEIEYGTAKRYPGNYSDFVTRKRENYNKQMKDYAAQQKEIERLQKIVEKNLVHPTKVSMARSKQKSIERMELIERPDRYNNKTFHAHFQPDIETGKDVLVTSKLQVGYDEVLTDVNLDLKRGEKLAILGGNGLGKSTFLKTIVGNISALGGEYRFGTNVQIGYFDQQMATYNSNKTVIDDLWDEFPTETETEIRNSLGAFLFSGDDVFKNIDMLSGGEKVRLALCKIFKRRPNVLILDEPTNHMDIVGKETLENMLKEFTGTLIFVSHDRYFVKSVATQLLVFEDGGTHLYRFGWEEYQEKIEKDKLALEGAYQKVVAFGGSVSNKGATQSNEIDSPMQKEQAGKVAYNLGKEKSKLQKKIKKLEETMSSLETKISELNIELTSPENQSNYNRLTRIQSEIDRHEEVLIETMEEWESALSELG